MSIEMTVAILLALYTWLIVMGWAMDALNVNTEVDYV